MKKTIFMSVAVIATAVLSSFTLLSANKETSKLPPCKKIYMTNSCGIIYYKCSRSGGGESSPDCYDVSTFPNNDGCNITQRPGCF